MALAFAIMHLSNTFYFCIAVHYLFILFAIYKLDGMVDNASMS